MSKSTTVAAVVILLAVVPVCLSSQRSQAPGDAAHLVRWAIGIAGGPEEPESAANHPEAAAIRRQPGGKAEMRSKTSSTEVCIRRLADGSLAVAAFNPGRRVAQVDVVWKELGIVGQPKVRDVLNGTDLGKVHGGFAVKLPAGGAALYRVTPPLKER